MDAAFGSRTTSAHVSDADDRAEGKNGGNEPEQPLKEVPVLDTGARSSTFARVC